jgi:hypothetical protein
MSENIKYEPSIFTWRTPSHGVGNSSDTFAEICSVDAFVLVPPNNVLISLVYWYTYFVVVRYANFPPAASNKHVHIIIYCIHDFTMNEKLVKKNVQPPSPPQKSYLCPCELYRNQLKGQPDVHITDKDGTYEYCESWLVFINLLLYFGQFSIALQLTECSNKKCILVWFCWKMG